MQLLVAVTVPDVLCSSFSRLGDEVLHRELIWVLVCLGHVLPLPKGALVKDNIARHVSSPPHRIIEPVRLTPEFIAYEDDLQPPGIKLGKVGTRDLHVCNAAEHSEMMYHWLLVVPGLVWRLPVEASRWRSIEEIDGRHYRLSPEPPRHPSRHQQ